LKSQPFFLTPVRFTFGYFTKVPAGLKPTPSITEKSLPSPEQAKG